MNLPLHDATTFYLFIHNVSICQTKSTMFYNVYTTYMGYLRKMKFIMMSFGIMSFQIKSDTEDHKHCSLLLPCPQMKTKKMKERNLRHETSKVLHVWMHMAQVETYNYIVHNI